MTIGDGLWLLLWALPSCWMLWRYRKGARHAPPGRAASVGIVLATVLMLCAIGSLMAVGLFY